MKRIGSGTVFVAQAAITGVVGVAAIKLAGAPNSALMVQVGGLLLGALLAIGLRLRPIRLGKVGAAVMLAVCLALVLFAVVGSGTQGVHRWVALGPVTIQPASVVLPFVILAWTAATPSLWASGLAGGLALIFALQPDAASATGLALGLIAATLVRRRACAAEIFAIACAVAATAWSWTRFDPLPAVAHVERVIGAAFAVSPVVGVAAGTLLLLIPAPFLWTLRRGDGEAGRSTAAALAGFWIGLVVANLFGNYPAPMLGYGASLALGWLGSLGLGAIRRRPCIG